MAAFDHKAVHIFIPKRERTDCRLRHYRTVSGKKPEHLVSRLLLYGMNRIKEREKKRRVPQFAHCGEMRYNQITPVTKSRTTALARIKTRIKYKEE
jgi:hypothetical protein